MEVLQDEDGNVIDANTSKFRIDETVDGVQQEVLS